MKFYELLYILPSKYAENEVDAVVATVTAIAEKAGAAFVSTKVLGRLKLAYVIDGSRFGTYVLCYLNAEPSAIPVLDRAFGLADEVLRHTILSAKEGDEKKKVEISSYVAPLSEEGREERTPERRPITAAPTPVRPAPTAALKPAEPAMSIEELDKKLDEILDADVTKGI